VSVDLRTLLPSAAAGTAWTNAGGALVEGGTVATYPANQAGANWLRLTSMVDRDLPSGAVVTGFTVRARLLATGALNVINAFGWCAPSYEANLPQATTRVAATFDGDLLTSYAPTVAGVTTIHDLGTARPVGAVFAGFRAAVDPVIAYSSDGVSWTNATGSAVSGIDFFTGAQVYDLTLTSTVSARFWRVSVDDSTGTNDARVREFKLYDAPGGTAYAQNVTTLQERLQIALTVNGTSEASDIRAVNVPTSDAWVQLGGAADLWGFTGTAVDVEASAFGVILRRGDVLGDEQTGSARQIDAVELIIAYDLPESGSNMPKRIVDLQKTIIGPESTSGTAVTPSVLLQTTALELSPNNSDREVELFGDTLAAIGVTDMLGATLSLGGTLTYDEIGYALSMLLGAPVTTSVGSGAFSHEWIYDSQAEQNPRSYTVQVGDEDFSEQSVFAVLAAMNIGFSGDGAPTVGGSGFAREVVQRENAGTRIGLAAGANAVQTFTVGGSPSGGSIVVSFKGVRATLTTSAWANAAALKAALEAISTIGSGNLTVTGSGPFTITFTGATVAGKPQPVILVESSALTGGTSPTVTTAITTVGGYTTCACVPVARGDFEVRYATTPAGLNDVANRIATPKELHAAAWSLSGKTAPVSFVDPTQPGFSSTGDASTTSELQLTITANAFAKTLRDDYKSKTVRFWRILATSAQLAASGVPYSLQIDTSGYVASENAFGASGVYRSQAFTVRATRSEVWNRSVRVILVNKIPSY
jgi:hypothetical protein